jgi:hypothetical protein
MFNLIPSWERLFILNPRVGLIFEISSFESNFNIVVLPALSRPKRRIYKSFLLIIRKELNKPLKLIKVFSNEWVQKLKSNCYYHCVSLKQGLGREFEEYLVLFRILFNFPKNSLVVALVKIQSLKKKKGFPFKVFCG